ncbi:MAG: branched-chain amino acid aminotransferase, partial [Alphaproteobacteria bacterium]|nr:branched-chain amino acid aminotransferase [Alphaproteobacteria bacterium]
VFDGARAIQGKLPDVARHSARIVRSAKNLGLAPGIGAARIEALIRAGVKRFPRTVDLYICPMFYAEEGFVRPDPKSTRFVLGLYESPVPGVRGFSACRSSFRKPAPDMAPTDAKAACLYPNIARSLEEADRKGFDTAVMFDPDGNVAEFSFTNLFFAKNGRVVTPRVNGTFLNGITRQRVIQLLRQAGVRVEERAVTFKELLRADEIFATGNYAKVQPCTRLEKRKLKPGPLFQKARALYLDFVADCP